MDLTAKTYLQCEIKATFDFKQNIALINAGRGVVAKTLQETLTASLIHRLVYIISGDPVDTLICSVGNSRSFISVKVSIPHTLLQVKYCI